MTKMGWGGHHVIIIYEIQYYERLYVGLLSHGIDPY